ncbi:MAG: mandelate racemase/muconate lactonizing enzyme family protein, partial [Halobacteriaceae archaeon]
MEVTDITAIPVEASVRPLSEGGIAPYVTNHGAVESMTKLLVRLETDTGVTGWGEMSCPMDPRATVAVVEHEIAPHAIGREVWEIEAFVDDFFYYYIDISSLLGGVEMAMWDALGKQLGAPLHKLLGGAVTDPVPVAYCVGIRSPEESREHVRHALAEGYPVLKTKAGRDWRTDVERMAAMHDEADGRLDLRVDPNQGWAFEDAVRVGAQLEDRGVYLQYLEQPCRIETYGTYAKLRERLRQPVAVNDDTYFAHNLYQYVRGDGVDVGVVDIVPSGITGTRRLAGVAADAGVSLAHHNGFDLGIKQAAVLQTVASTPAFTLPPDTVYYAWADHVIEEPLAIEDGAMPVPDGPGLGVDVDEQRVEEL